MIGYAILAAALALPLALGLVFRVSASHLFFSVMAGELLARYFGFDAENALGSVVGEGDLSLYGEVLVLTAPMVLTAIFLRGTLRHSQLPLHILPLAITGLVYASFLLPMLPTSVQEEIQTNRIGEEMLHLNGVIIGSVVIIQLGAFWVFNRHKNAKRSRGKD